MGYKNTFRKINSLSNAIINNSLKIAKAQHKALEDKLYNINASLPHRELMLKRSLATTKPVIYWGYVLIINIFITISAFYISNDINTAFITFISLMILCFLHFLVKRAVDILSNTRLIEYNNKLHKLNELIEQYIDILYLRKQKLIKLDAYNNILTKNWDKEKTNFIRYTIRKNHLFDDISASEISYVIELLLKCRRD